MGRKADGFGEGPMESTRLSSTIAAALRRQKPPTSAVVTEHEAACAKLFKLGFPGGTYEQLFYVADVKIALGFDPDLYINLGEHILSLMFPVRSSGMQRLIGLVPPDLTINKCSASKTSAAM